MSRPWRDPQTGLYYLRKRVPTDLVAMLDKAIHKESLGTKDAAQAKIRHTEALAKLERRWANLRVVARPLTEPEAHALAFAVHEQWLRIHSDFPSWQLVWDIDLYGTLWTAGPLPEIEPQPGVPGERPAENIICPNMRRMCWRKTDELISEHGLNLDRWSRFTLAKAVAAAYQRASVELPKQEHGVFDYSRISTHTPASFEKIFHLSETFAPRLR